MSIELIETNMKISHLGSLLLAASLLGVAVPLGAAKDVKLLNVSYDPTRELYTDFNSAFAKHWKEKTGDTVTISQSHGGSSKQATTVSQNFPKTKAWLINKLRLQN